ncbi:MAG: hypothetical protein ACKVP7_20270 [Hyphomicrobiaceae bacterium]
MASGRVFSGRFTVTAVLLAGGVGMAAQPVSACVRADFERVVEEAASALRELNLANKPLFQGRLGELKQKRGWNHDQFIAQAAPLVQDERIAVFDSQASALLERLQSGGQEGAQAREPDCALLSELRVALKSLIDVQKAKWSYMLGRVEAELAK